MLEQTESESKEIQPLTLSKMISGSFNIFGKEYLKFGTLTLIGTIVLLMFGTWWAITFFSSIFSNGLYEMPENIELEDIGGVGMIIGFGIATVVTFVMSVWTDGAIRLLAAAVYAGERLSFKASLRHSLNGLLRMLGVFFTIGLLFYGLASLLRIILSSFMTLSQSISIYMAWIFLFPGTIYIVLRLLFIPQAIFIEKSGIIGAVKRSWKLVSGFWWHTFGYVLVLFLVTFAVSLGLGFIPFGPVISPLITTPVDAIGLTLIYFDLRARKEGVTPDMIKTEIGIPVTKTGK